jgi:hypothetical protein
MTVTIIAITRNMSGAIAAIATIIAADRGRVKRDCRKQLDNRAEVLLTFPRAASDSMYI